jgi:hypothetical protein
LNVEVLNYNKLKIGEFKIFGYSDKIQFVDLNNDGNKQIVLWTQGKEGYTTSLAIYGLRNNAIIEIFRVESNNRVEADFDSPWPEIKSGPTTWIWNGRNFVER